MPSRKLKQEESLIEVTEFQENEDGSAVIKVETSPEVTAILVGVGLKTLVKQAMQEAINDKSGM
jgi:hypothetical protein